MRGWRHDLVPGRRLIVSFLFSLHLSSLELLPCRLSFDFEVALHAVHAHSLFCTRVEYSRCPRASRRIHAR